MGRPKKPRFVRFDPDVVYFKPRGVPLSSLEEVKLAVEELEALRLKDLEGLEQTEAAKKMKVSQSTLQRILSKARKKISLALIKGRAIKIKGGDFIMPRFRPGTGMGAGRGAGGRGRMGGPYAAGPGGECQCTDPKCDYIVPHQAGVPCMQTKCPKCGSPMVRKM